MVMGMTGCSEKDTDQYAVIVNNATTESQKCTDEVWDGLKTYAQTKGDVCERYTADGTERKHYAAAIEAAVDDGADVIICVGEELEVPVSEAQTDYPRVKFILINGEPHKRYSDKANIKENTISLYFNETQQGYMLGYMAVMGGYRHIGCMGGTETETNLKVAAGFVQGVEAAAKELGLSEGDVQLYYTFTGVDKVSPVYMSRAIKWYQAGCEVIFALGDGVRTSVVEAAKIQSGMVLGTDKDELVETDKLLTAAEIDYAGAVINQIEQMEAETFVGGQVLNCGVKEKGIFLVTENTTLSDNTIAEYHAVCQKVAEGTLKIEETMVVPATAITVVTKE